MAGALWGSGANPSTITVPLSADGELLGFLVARAAGGRTFDDDDRDLASSIAAQTAVGIKKIRLIEGLEERNLIKDFFADLIAGRRREGLGSRARRLGCDLDQPKLALVAVPWRGEPRSDADVAQAMDRFQHACGRALPGVLFDRRDELTRGLVPALGGDERESIRRLQKALAEGGTPLPLVVGVSNPCVGTEAIATGFEEAQQAARAAPVITNSPAIVPFDGLGPYKYLLRVPIDDRLRDRHREALRRLLDYDRARQAQLTRTLEEFLRQRGNISATAQALYVHPNTLRQRLRRIADLTQIDVRTDDWLMIEIALKLLKLEEALDRG
jgi:purine catabolism regulator